MKLSLNMLRTVSRKLSGTVAVCIRSLRSSLTRSPRTAAEVLALMVRHSEFKEILQQTTDSRALLSVIASKLNKSEEDLLLILSNKLSLEHITRVPALDPEHIPSKVTIPLLRDAGATLLAAGEGGFRIVCVEPRLVEHKLFASGIFPRSTPLILSTWRAIEEALNKGEDLERENAKKREEDTLHHARGLISRVIPVIVGEAERFGRSSVVVHLDGPESTYAFLTQEGKHAVGSLHPKVGNAFRIGFVEKEISMEGITRADGSLIESFHYRVEQVASGKIAVHLSWIRSVGKILPNEKTKEIHLNKKGGLRVLLVDDNPTFARVLARYLTKDNIDAVYAKNGGVALDLLETLHEPPVVIVCDVHMPGMNGFEFVAKLKANTKYARIPIVMLTSDSDTDTKVGLIAAGVDAFVNKAEDPRVLLIHVTKLIERVQREAA